MAWTRTTEGLRMLPRLLLRRELQYDFDGIPLRARNLPLRKIFNLVKVGLDAAIRSNRAHGLPPLLQIEPTNLCNLRCPLCPTGSRSAGRPTGTMSMETFGSILQGVGHALLSVCLYGYGEPFMNRHLPRMIRACSRRGILTVTTTNGHFITTPEEAMQVVDAGLSVLILAIDGSTQELYSEYRRGGSFEKVRRCAELVEAAKRERRSEFPYTVVRCVGMRHNERDIPNIELLAQELGVNMFTVKSVGCRTDSEDYADFEPSGPEMRRFRDGKSSRDEGAPVLCPFPFRQPTVFWDGTLVGSEHDQELELPFGRLGEASFREMWNSPNAIRMRRSLRRGRDLPGFCGDCPHRDQTRRGVGLLHREFRPLSANSGAPTHG